MNLPKAIGLLQHELDNPDEVDIFNIEDAQRLGIEALKREQEHRIGQKPTQIWLLPGETEE